jgi:hypothetical protein
MVDMANYGYVPFPHFQFVMYLTQFLLIYYHKEVNRFLDDQVNDHHNNGYKILKRFLLSIPLLTIAYYDILYGSFSFKNLGVPVEYNRVINQALFILGSYGVIQVLAQDSGIRTGVAQRDTVQTRAWFAFMAVGMAYSLTKNRSQSVLAMMLYFHLRYVISDNVTSQVCFESI